MFPYLHTPFGFSIPLYGVMTALAYGTGFYYLYKNREKVNLTKDQLTDLVFYLIVGALLGGKLFYIWFNFTSFIASTFVEKLRFGFVFLGGLIGGLGFLVFWLKKNKKDFFEISDFIAPALALGQSIGRIGCFLAGCCYGKESHNLLAVKYTSAESLVPNHLHNTPLYPVQLMESLLVFCLFLVLRNYYKKSHNKGFILASYLLGYGVIRFCLEFFRFDDRGTYFLGMSPSQNISILLVISAIIIFYKGCLCKKKS